MKTLPTPRQVACVAVLLMPLGLLHAFVLAEIAMAVTDLLFLHESWKTRNFTWARQPWFVAAFIWWLWLMICSTPLTGFTTAGWRMSFLEALVIIRFLVLAAALQNWVLTTRRMRNAMWLALAGSCLWIGVEAWQQYLTGHDIFGFARWPDGSLTGPFYKPRAGAPYAHLLFTAILPLAVLLMADRRKALRWGGTAFYILAIVTTALIGQRMATALTGLGVVVAALLIREVRKPAAFAIAATAIFILATPLLSPRTHSKLVVETEHNLGRFSHSPYGELYTRGTVMALQSPWHGWGFNGFRAFCPEPRFDGGLPALGIGPTSLKDGACNLHPHNFYIQAFLEGGIPGLVLFCIMNLTWLVTLLRGLFRRPLPVRVGLFIGVLTFAWPIASTDDFAALYMTGWLFLMLGLGLSLPRSGSPEPACLYREDTLRPIMTGSPE